MFKKQSSFTLVELLIVIGIIMVFTILSLSIMVSIKQKREVKTVAEQIKSRIMEAHSFAVSPPEKYSDTTTDVATGLTNVQIQITNGSPATLQIVGIPLVSGKNFVQSYNLPSNITFRNSTDTADLIPGVIINFDVSGSTIGQISTIGNTPAVASGILTFKVKNTNGKTSTVTVNQYTGSVEVK